jgi:IclR family acetate operon transcriptional repressor
MDVKLVARTLELFELFAREGRPLSLTEMARALSVPMSSTLGLVRTLAARGYLYEVRRRGGYYPTQRMGGHMLRIQASDPLLHLVRPRLTRLRDECGETVVFGKCQESHVIYLEAAASRESIRYMVEPGETRPLHANSIGKAILSRLEPAARDKLLAAIEWPRLTPATLTDRDALLEDLGRAARRGWAENRGESIQELSAIAVPLRFGAEWYGISIAGPSFRMEPAWDHHVDQLLSAVAQLQSPAAGTASATA